MGTIIYSMAPTSEEDCHHPINDDTSVDSEHETYIRSPLSSDNEDENNNQGDENDSTASERVRRNWALVLFSVTTILLFADQNLMSPNLTAIADDFGLNDDERDRKLGGDISLAFFIIGAPASFFVGLLADTGDRPKIFGWTVFVGEFACFMTYFVQSYYQLYICRAITGFSVGGALPVIYSILGDLFAAGDRHVVSAIVSFGLGAGISLGQAVAGFLGPIYGWRLPFLIISLPALFCAAAVYFTVEDPERGGMERTVVAAEDPDAERLVVDDGEVALVPISSRTSLFESGGPVNSSDEELPTNPDSAEAEQKAAWKKHLKTSMDLFSTKTVALSLIQGAPGCIPWGIINVFLNDYLSEDRGFSIQSATTVLMCFSVGYALGLMLGGAGGKFLYKIDIRLPALLAGVTAIIGCFPLWFLLNGVDASTPFFAAAFSAVVAGMGSAPTGPIIKATLTNVTLPRSRGQAFALFNLFDDFGKGLGPFFVSLLIVQFGGRTKAFNVGVFGWILCGLANIAIFFTVAHDERVVQATLAVQTNNA